MQAPNYRLLNAFASLFQNGPYNPRSPIQGDRIAAELFDDLLSIAPGVLPRSKYEQRVRAGSRIVNPKNRTVGLNGRRGDGTFGALLPQTQPIWLPTSAVGRGRNAYVEIGCEVKVLATAQQRQAPRVQSDLKHQVAHFNSRKSTRTPITIGIVGVNHAEQFSSRIGNVVTTTNGVGSRRHPYQEAAAATQIVQQAAPLYDELLIVDYNATNDPPYPFTFAQQLTLIANYSALLARVIAEYDNRF